MFVPSAFVSSWITIESAPIGSGPPVILLHGGLANSDYWGHQVPELAKTHRVIVMDSRGHGRSTRFGQPFGYQLMQQRCRHTFGGGKGNAEGVLLPWIAIVVTYAAPQVNNLVALMVNTHRATARGFLQLAAKNMLHGLECRVGIALYCLAGAFAHDGSESGLC